MPGYVALQRIPYRGHDLIARTVSAHTQPGDCILDAGVSSGYLAKVFVDGGRRVDGVDIDEDAIEEAKAICEIAVAADLQTFDFSPLRENYQVILFADTLEHLPDPAQVLRRALPHLSNSGVLIASMPNVANWAIRLSLLLGRFRYTDRGILDRTHLRFFTKKTLLELIAGSGYEVVDLVATVPVPGIRNRSILALAYWIGNLWPSFFGYQFLVTARPRRQ